MVQHLAALRQPGVARLGGGAVEPVIGHLKADHRMDRNQLKGRTGDAMNAILAAAGYNFSRLLAWIALLWACCQAFTQIKSYFTPA